MRGAVQTSCEACARAARCGDAAANAGGDERARRPAAGPNVYISGVTYALGIRARGRRRSPDIRAR